MLKWLTTRAFNNFDVAWIGLSALCMRDHNYLAAGIAVGVGSFVSGFMEGWQARRPPTE